ncbi:Flavin-dependent oxidoreductase, luciferase family (includes alkanesulfonate monooxygenase SsuD and methylene tetrahydromethanopterin reductase) [Streptomyces sp. cf124]|uniref:LLM class flavin-dependent oxidoreductase n=1 Tax=Streptomyces sp. cf124 TaxID=1761903 RepID=UPI0008E60448|nr:LLM class flavin-dependent oxidoreductase [Streptomyces sp. cf124]SFN93884.1 Flavin-dependent oxidoreductase, luciferase family (includes alkanesulfonate monooxygenase SsuD and methylene tetrahydromethanopterin reductase) [Streptomyces sp. cf124]
MRYSILLPLGPTRPEQAVPFANLVQWTAAERLWMGQGMVLESHHLVSWLAGIGIRVPAGFGVSLMPFRSPYLAAVEARSVALTTGHPLVAGFGPGAKSLQKGVLGRPYASPLRASREYLQIVRGLLSGDQVDVSGDFHSVSGSLTKTHAPPVHVGLGVLREGMAVLAGEMADVAVTWMGSARYVGDTLLPAIRSADRALEAPVKVTAIVPVALSGEDRDVTELAGAACGSHLQLEHYRDTLHRAGITVSGEHRADDAMRLVDGGVFLYGTVEEIHQRLEEYRVAGVDEVVLNTTGVAQIHGPKAAARDLLTILSAVPPS